MSNYSVALVYFNHLTYLATAIGGTPQNVPQSTLLHHNNNKASARVTNGRDAFNIANEQHMQTRRPRQFFNLSCCMNIRPCNRVGSESAAKHDYKATMAASCIPVESAASRCRIICLQPRHQHQNMSVRWGHTWHASVLTTPENIVFQLVQTIKPAGRPI